MNKYKLITFMLCASATLGAAEVRKFNGKQVKIYQEVIAKKAKRAGVITTVAGTVAMGLVAYALYTFFQKSLKVEKPKDYSADFKQVIPKSSDPAVTYALKSVESMRISGARTAYCVDQIRLYQNKEVLAKKKLFKRVLGWMPVVSLVNMFVPLTKFTLKPYRVWQKHVGAYSDFGLFTEQQLEMEKSLSLLVRHAATVDVLMKKALPGQTQRETLITWWNACVGKFEMMLAFLVELADKSDNDSMRAQVTIVGAQLRETVADYAQALEDMDKTLKPGISSKALHVKKVYEDIRAHVNLVCAQLDM